MFIPLTPHSDTDLAEYRVDFDRGIVLKGKRGVTVITRLTELNCKESPQEIAALIAGRGKHETVVTDDMVRAAVSTEYDMRSNCMPYPDRMRAALMAALR